MYTEKEHAERMLQILSMPNPCMKCPAFVDLTVDYYDNDGYFIYGDYPRYTGVCKICKKFIGFGDKELNGCPCTELGKEEAIKFTWLALEEKGYI